MENEIRAIRLFVDSTHSRANFRQPFKFKDVYGATDGSALIYTKKVLDFEEIEKPDITSVVPESNISIKLNVKEFRSKLIPEMIQLSFKCTECNGEGNVTCNYKHEHECGECAGQGKIFDTRGLQMENPDTIYAMFDNYFRYEYLNKLLSACELIGIEEIEMISKGINRSFLFTGGEYYFLIMPCIGVGEDVKTKSIVFSKFE